MATTPEGWSRICSSLSYENASLAIDFLCDAFGFEVKLRVDAPDGKVVHSELVVDGGLIMVCDNAAGEKESKDWQVTPAQAKGNTQSLMMFVDDVEAHLAHVRKSGAKIVSEPKVSDYGEEYWADRSYECEDIGGHHWYFVQRLSTGAKQ